MFSFRGWQVVISHYTLNAMTHNTSDEKPPATRYSPPARYTRQTIAMTTDATADAIQAEAAERGVSKGQVVREALEAYFKRPTYGRTMVGR